ncbi:M20 family metallopeptidase [Candidatus Bathyarchaeota archaeon]|nr:M20 family metallopeptidase [Candidatus Bathyarchaeota archaeon]
MNLVNEEEVVEVLRELIRRPSQNPPGNEKVVAEYIYEKMKHWGFEPKYVYKPEPSRPSVGVVYKGSEGKPRLILNGHIDVVPEGDLSNWSVTPYEGIVKEGRIYGRGACDMKGGIAAAMIAAKVIKESGVELRGDLVLQFAMGEETGEAGTKSLLEEDFVGDWGIVLEPTDLKVMTAEKGLAWYHINIKGKPTHASRPELGINAIYKALKLISAIREYNDEIGKRIHPLCGKDICTVTMIRAGTKENVIPESCWLSIDRRIIPGEKIEQVDKEIEEIIRRISSEDPEFRCEWKRVMLYESAEIPVDHEIAEVVRKNTKEITGVYPEPAGTLGSTDQRNFINDFNIPAITWGPGWEKSHEIDEYVEIRKVVDCAKILVLTILDLLK